MPSAAALIDAQRADYAGLLAAVRALLETPGDAPGNGGDGPLTPEALTAYGAARAACVARTGPRESDLAAALAQNAHAASADAVACYREVLEALVAAEAELARRAGAVQAGLRDELARMAEGRRALEGYRLPRAATPARAVSQRV